MAIVKSDIKDKLIAMFEDMASTTLTAEEARDFIADEWATIISDAIKSADVTGVTTIVATSGSATNQTGTGTQNNTGTLS